MNKPNSSLSQFIEEHPLYSKFGTDQPIEAADLENLVFNFFCKHEKEVQPFRLGSATHNGNSHPGSTSAPIVQSLNEGAIIDFTQMFTGVCQSCEKYHVNIIISGVTQKEKPKYFIRKIGQYPAPESSIVKLPNDMSDFLNEENCELYRKGLKNLELEYGIGALSYFRKMIENQLDRIIGALSDPYSPDGHKIAEAVAAYKKDQQKSKLIEDITQYLPRNLKEHGANILLVLCDAASMDIDEFTEKQCIKKAKDIDTIVRYLVRKIYEERSGVTTEKDPGKYFLRYS
jgi:hypothetical protein